MTLTYYKDNYELFQNMVLWWQGRDQTSLGFPILPAGVTVTPNGSWTDLTTDVTRSVKNFTSSNLNRIVLSDNDAWNFGSGSLSICYWVKWTYITGYAQGIVTQRYKYNSNIALDCYIESNAKMHLFVYTCTSSPKLGMEDTSTFPLNEWHYINFIKDGDVAYYYKDGNFVDSATTTGFTQCDSTRPLVIGALEASGNFLIYNHFDGNIKDLMIYKGRALTQPEIIEIMRLTNPASGRDFAAIYPGIRGVE